MGNFKGVKGCIMDMRPFFGGNRRGLKCFVVKTAFRTNPNIRVYMRAKSLHVQLFGTPWTVAQQAFLSMGFSRQEYWSGLLYPPPGDLPSPGLD